jgi:hypothetical protein
MPNEETKNERRSRLAAIKAQRAATGANMFKGNANLISMPIGGPTLANPATAHKVFLKPANQFTGKQFTGLLPEAERKQLRTMGLPTTSIQGITGPSEAPRFYRNGEPSNNVLSQLAARKIILENEANARRTKAASEPNNAGNVNANANDFVDRVKVEQLLYTLIQTLDNNMPFIPSSDIEKRQSIIILSSELEKYRQLREKAVEMVQTTRQPAVIKMKMAQQIAAYASNIARLEDFLRQIQHTPPARGLERLRLIEELRSRPEQLVSLPPPPAPLEPTVEVAPLEPTVEVAPEPKGPVSVLRPPYPFMLDPRVQAGLAASPFRRGYGGRSRRYRRNTRKSRNKRRH